MRITKKLLEEKNACAEWLACFNAAFPDGIDLKDWTVEKQIEVLKSDLRVYIGWAFERGIIPLWSMQGANLGGANLRGAYLRGAYLECAYLEGANLRGAYLRDAYLEGANLGGANLGGANLRGAYLRDAYLEGAKYDKSTIFPAGFDAKEKGACLVE